MRPRRSLRSTMLLARAAAARSCTRHSFAASCCHHPRPHPRHSARLLSTAVNPMFDLTGLNALVTGGARDIGGACAVELARAGADVVVNYFGSEEAAAATVDEIRSLGSRATAVRANVFEAEGIAHLVSEAEAFFEGGRIDVLVNNAGGLNLRGELCDDA